jgi:hypothetical protein
MKAVRHSMNSILDVLESCANKKPTDRGGPLVSQLCQVQG